MSIVRVNLIHRPGDIAVQRSGAQTLQCHCQDVVRAPAEALAVARKLLAAAEQQFPRKRRLHRSTSACRRALLSAAGKE